MESIKQEIEKLLKQAGLSGQIELSVPPKPEMGDLSFSCFNLAKEKNKNPAEVAGDLAKKCLAQNTKYKILDTISATGPYLNFFLKPSAVAAAIVPEILKLKNKYGLNKSGGGKQIIVEYPSNNTHKELHVGHLRNICIGNSLVKLFEANGYKVVPINYINDFGAHVAKCLWGLQKFHAKETPPENKQKWLGEIYAEASRYLAENPKAKNEVAEIQRQLENKDKKLVPIFKRTRQWSLDGFKAVFHELKVKHAKVFYESALKASGQKIVDQLLKKQIASVGEGGAIIANLEKYGLDIALLRKSDGGGVYLTSDLALAALKDKKFPKAEASVHITGSEQDFYFKQLFKILELAGYKFKMSHIGYGLVNLPEGKMSSRSGNVILYEDLRDEALKQSFEETAMRHPDWPPKKIISVASAVALAAVKFEFLKHEAAKTIVFDIKNALAFDGFTGPYVLYTVARINSLIKKVKDKKLKINSGFNSLKEPEEKRLVLILSRFEENLEKALTNLNPSVMTKYTFDAAKAFSEFYGQCDILKAASPELAGARLSLAIAAKTVLENSLAVLSIEPVEEM